METLALTTTTTTNKPLNPLKPQLHSIKTPKLFAYKTPKYHINTPFTIITTCKLVKTPKASTKSKNKPIKVVGPDEKAPLLLEEKGGGGERRKTVAGGEMGLVVKRFTKRVLSVLSNLPLAIGEMFTIAGLMAVGMCFLNGCYNMDKLISCVLRRYMVVMKLLYSKNRSLINIWVTDLYSVQRYGILYKIRFLHF